MKGWVGHRRLVSESSRSRSDIWTFIGNWDDVECANCRSEHGQEAKTRRRDIDQNVESHEHDRAVLIHVELHEDGWK